MKRDRVSLPLSPIPYELLEVKRTNKYNFKLMIPLNEIKACIQQFIRQTRFQCDYRLKCKPGAILLRLVAENRSCKRAFIANKPVPRVFHLPTPMGAREERPMFRLVTCPGDKFIFMGGLPVFQNVTSQTDFASLRATLKALCRFPSEALSYLLPSTFVILFDTQCLPQLVQSVIICFANDLGVY